MSSSKRKGGQAYFIASIVSQASALMRYVILARLLGPEQLGLAAMLILTAQFFESISDTGSDRFLVQDKDGDAPGMQGLVQLVLALRGLIIALSLALSAGLLAKLYRAPMLEISLIALGIAPLIGGLIHLDLRRVQRSSDFRPESLAMIVSETVSLAATTLAALIVRDHTAVIYGLVFRAISLVAVSHLTARRPYRWAFGSQESRTFSVFALPLFLNGFLLFFGSQGDRLVVGNGLGPTALGHYSAALLLVYYPSSILARFLTGIHLPQIAAARSTLLDFKAVQDSLAGRTLLLAVGVVVGFALVGPYFTTLLYGAGFAQPLSVFALMGALQGARFLRLWPTTLAVGVGRSTIVMFNNVARMIALPLALLANALYPSLEAIIAGFVIGELVALTAALLLLRHAGHVALRRESYRVLLFCFAATVTIGTSMLLQTNQWPAAIACVAMGLAVAVAVGINESATLSEILVVVRRGLRRGKR